eukprot:m.309735 g.309735  ORF g.309735 m.309735 type:complete len:159 (+) comp47514_c0_seq1:146-622(+)
MLSRSPGILRHATCMVFRTPFRASIPATVAHRQNSTVDNSKEEPAKLSTKARLKVLARDYGSTVLVFHTTISLSSLGLAYLLVSRGIDVPALIHSLGIKQGASFASGAGTFAVAYACHKVFAPVRLAITAGATPLIVRYLRARGWIKPPAVGAAKQEN